MYIKTIVDYNRELRLAYKAVEDIKTEVRNRLKDLCIANPEVIISGIYGNENPKLSDVLDIMNNQYYAKMAVETALGLIQEINGIISNQS